MQIAHFYNMVIIGQGKSVVKKYRYINNEAELYKTDFEIIKKCLVLLIYHPLCYTDCIIASQMRSEISLAFAIHGAYNEEKVRYFFNNVIINLSIH